MAPRDELAARRRVHSWLGAVLETLDAIPWPAFVIALMLGVAAFQLLYLLRALQILAHLGSFGGSPSYGSIAANLLESGRFTLDGMRFTAYRPPLYPLFLSGMMGVFGTRWLEAAMVVQALFTLATGALVLRLVHMLTPDRLAMLLAAGFFATDLYFHYDALCEIETPLFIVLATASIALLARPRLGSSAWLALGLGIGLAHLTRPTGLLLLPLFAARVIEARHDGPRAWRGPTLAALAFVLVVAPWQLTLRRHLGITTVVSSTTGGSNLYKGNNPDFLTLYPRVNLDPYEPWIQRLMRANGVDSTDEVRKDRLLQGKALAFVREHPGAALQGAAIKLMALYSPRAMPLGRADMVDRGGRVALENYRSNDSLLLRVETFQWSIVLFGALLFAVGRAGPVFREARRLLLYTAAFIALCTLTQVVTISGTRFRLPLDPFLVMMAAAFYAWAVRQVASPRPET